MRSELGLASLLVASRAFAQAAPDPGPAPVVEAAPVVDPAPAPVVAPTPVVEPPPPAAPAVARATPPRGHSLDDEALKSWAPHIADRGLYGGLEVGSGGFADSRNIYKDGLGRGFVLGYSYLEFRAEQYDMTDRSGMFTNVAHGDGIASITSFAGRIPLASTEMIEASALVGLAVVSRPSMIAGNEGDASLGSAFLDDQVVQGQWGVGAVLGAGLQLGGIFYIDARIYPTYWASISGMRYEYDETTHTAAKVMTTQEQSPGGMPITFNAGIGYGF